MNMQIPPIPGAEPSSPLFHSDDDLHPGGDGVFDITSALPDTPYVTTHKPPPMSKMDLAQETLILEATLLGLQKGMKEGQER